MGTWPGEPTTIVCSTGLDDGPSECSAISPSNAASSNAPVGERPSSTARTIADAVMACSVRSRSNGTPKPNARCPMVASRWSAHVEPRRRRPGVGCGAKPLDWKAATSLPADRARRSLRVVVAAGSVGFLPRTWQSGLHSANDNAVITSPPPHDMWWSSRGIDTRRHQMWWLGPFSRELLHHRQLATSDARSQSNTNTPGRTAQMNNPGPTRDEMEQQ